MKKVTVNQDCCIGCGMCAGIASNVFEMDSNGLSTVKEGVQVSNDDKDVMNAAEGCPTGAIVVETVEESEEN